MENGQVNSVIVGKIVQGYSLNLNLNVVKSTDFSVFINPSCQPRQGAEKMKKEPLALPKEIISFIVAHETTLLNWLLKDAKNKESFLIDPLSSLKKAGIKLDKTTEKALIKLKNAGEASEIVTPALHLKSVTMNIGKTIKDFNSDLDC
jgi:hypothetical protein